MKNYVLTTAAVLAANAGLAMAQPTVDGVIDAGEQALYTTNFIQDVPTQFGESPAGTFRAGGSGGTIVLGDPNLVTTGIEICIPKSALGGASTFDFFAIYQNGDRKYPSNQMSHAGDQPQNIANLGATLGYDVLIDYGIDVPGTQSINIAGIPVVGDGTVVMDGQADAGYSQYFVQNNYTGFGDADCGNIAPACGGGEIDNVAFAQDTNNIYMLVAGNLENNGNGMDFWFSTGAAGGQNTIVGGAIDSGNGVSFVLNNQAGDTMEAGFNATHMISVDYSFGVLRALYADVAAGSVQLAGEGLPADTTVGGAVANAEVAGFLLTHDNSNVDGVPGAEIGTVLPNEPDSPTSPDAVWSYGSELDNVRSYIDVLNNKLYLFLGGNLGTIDRNRFMMFFDVQAGGQNTLGINPDTLAAVTNQDITFGAMRAGKLEGSTFDAGFNADYFMNFSWSITGAGSNLDPTENYTDVGIVRTNGMLIDDFFAVPADWAAYNGDLTPFAQTFPGTYADPADGRDFLGTDGGPRLTTDAFGAPVGSVISAFGDNSNVGGVTDLAADCALAEAVASGYELCIDLDELGWDGVQDILLVAAVVNENFTFLSNQVAGDTSAIVNNLGAIPFDFSGIAGNQYVNLMTDAATCTPPCIADLNGDGILDNGDIGTFVTLFLAGDLAADMNGDGILDNGDIGTFVAAFLAGC
ncbi:MAG: hypothetical protein ACI89L_000850 [Phycisphaerales bacterium]|jgi:hypothetical protein